MTRVPRLLNPDFTEFSRARPTAFSLNLQRRQTSYAQITYPRTVGIAMHSWAELYTARGSVGLYRVTEIDDTLPTETAYTYRHGIDTLSDSVWKAQLDYTGTVPGYLAALLAQQTTAMWQLGTCEETKVWKRSGINYDRLSDLLSELMDELFDCYLTYDFSTTPWTLNLLKAPAGVRSEFRLSRNIETCRIRHSDADQATRLYLSINTSTTSGDVTTNNVELRTYNNTAAQATYGIIEKTADIDTADVADPDAWAAEYLARRADPAAQISIEGVELASITGLTWDEYDLAALVRVVTPRVAGVLEERVEAVSYPDVLGQPLRVTVELANRLAKVSTSIASLRKQTARAGAAARSASRSGAKAGELSHWAQIVQYHTDELADTGLTDLYETGIILDAQTGATLYSLTQGFQSQYAAINVNSAAITSEATTRATDDSALSSRITQNANAIALRVEKGDVATQLTVEMGNVSISGGNLLVDGYATVGALATTNANMTNFLAGNTTATKILTNRADIGALYVPDSGDSWHQATWKDQYVLTGRGTITMPSLSLSQRQVVYISGGQETSGNYYLITSYTAGSVGNVSGTTIHYLGY